MALRLCALHSLASWRSRVAEEAMRATGWRGRGAVRKGVVARAVLAEVVGKLKTLLAVG